MSPRRDRRGVAGLQSGNRAGLLRGGVSIRAQPAKELDVPVGILTLAFGASTAESWIPREAMAADPLLKPMLDKFDAAVQFFRANPDAPPEQAPKPPQTINARAGPPGAAAAGPGAGPAQPTVLFNGMINPAIPYAHPRRDLVPGRIHRRRQVRALRSILT